MKILYNKDFNLTAKPAKRVLPATNSVIEHYLTSPEVDSVALIGCSFTSCKIEYSTDLLSWTSVASNLTVTEDGLIITFPKVIGAKHLRVVNTGTSGTYQLLYPGLSLEVKEPLYPFDFKYSVITDTRTNLAGAAFSKILRKVWQGSLELSFDETENLNFQKVYSASEGLTKAVVIELNLLNKSFLVSGTTEYPLSLVSNNRWDGSWFIQELV